MIHKILDNGSTWIEPCHGKILILTTEGNFRIHQHNAREQFVQSTWHLEFVLCISNYFYKDQKAELPMLLKVRSYLFTFVGSKIRNCFLARFLTNFTHESITVSTISILVIRGTTFWISFHPSITIWSLIQARIGLWIFFK